MASKAFVRTTLPSVYALALATVLKQYTLGK